MSEQAPWVEGSNPQPSEIASADDLFNLEFALVEFEERARAGSVPEGYTCTIEEAEPTSSTILMRRPSHDLKISNGDGGWKIMSREYEPHQDISSGMVSTHVVEIPPHGRAMTWQEKALYVAASPGPGKLILPAHFSTRAAKQPLRRGHCDKLIQAFSPEPEE